MAGSREKKSVENPKSLSVQSSPPEGSPEGKGTKPLYQMPRLHPNHIHPSYRPPGTLRSLGIEMGVDLKAQPRRTKKKKAD